MAVLGKADLKRIQIDFQPVVNLGVNSSGNAITGERGDATNMFDGDARTFYSVGFGGSVSLTANLNHHRLTSGTVIEITFLETTAIAKRFSSNSALPIRTAIWSGR